MASIIEPLLTLFLVCWGLYILAYGVGAATTHPVAMLGRMIRALGRGLLWGCVWASKLIALVLGALSDGLRRLLD